MICAPLAMRGRRIVPPAVSATVLGGAVLVLTACLSGKGPLLHPPTAADAAPEAVRSMAAQEFAWPPRSIEVTPMARLGARQGCRFFAARHTRLLDGPVLGYAVLPDQALLGARQPDRAARILTACGQGEDALWWAGVAARFADAGGLLVDEHAPTAIRRIRASGAPGWQPTLDASADGTVVTFYTHDYALSQTWHVRATLTPQGELRLDKTALRNGRRRTVQVGASW